MLPRPLVRFLDFMVFVTVFIVLGLSLDVALTAIDQPAIGAVAFALFSLVGVLQGWRNGIP